MSCQDIIRQTRSSRIKYVHSALQEIKRKYAKTPKDVEKLVLGGLVSRLLELIRTRASLEEEYGSRVTELAVSVLGNMCMESCTRDQVLKEKGLSIIAELFLSAETSSVQNRACRCIANLLLHPGSWRLAGSTAIIERIVKLLRDSENDEHKLTFIRAIRLLGKTGSMVQKLVEKSAVCVIGKLIDFDMSPLAQGALRCLHSLSIHSCSLEFAGQMISCGKVEALLDQTRVYNDTAFQLLIKLSSHHTFQVELGNCGGITVLHDLVKRYKELNGSSGRKQGDNCKHEQTKASSSDKSSDAGKASDCVKQSGITNQGKASDHEIPSDKTKSRDPGKTNDCVKQSDKTRARDPGKANDRVKHCDKTKGRDPGKAIDISKASEACKPSGMQIAKSSDPVEASGCSKTGGLGKGSDSRQANYTSKETSTDKACDRSKSVNATARGRKVKASKESGLYTGRESGRAIQVEIKKEIRPTTAVVGKLLEETKDQKEVVEKKSSGAIGLSSKSDVKAIQNKYKTSDFSKHQSESTNDSKEIITIENRVNKAISDVDEARTLQKWFPDILTVLSLCCKEAVNRVKLREEKVLLTLLEELDNIEVREVHGRMVSALVCFLYDDPGFDMLLEGGLVKVLVKQLKICCLCESGDTTEPYADKKPESLNLVSDREKTGGKEKVKNGTNMSVVISVNADERNNCRIQNSTETAFFPEQVETEKSSTAAECSVVKSWENDVRTIYGDKEPSKRNKPVYSMDSPTYETQSDWRPPDNSDESSGTCLALVSPNRDVSMSAAMYSPVSNVSYYSPSESSPENSPKSSLSASPERGNYLATCWHGNHGSNMATGSQSPESMHPKYLKYTGLSCQSYQINQSPISRTRNVFEWKNVIGKSSTKYALSFSSDSEEGFSGSESPVTVISGTNELPEYSPVGSPSTSDIEEMDKVVTEHIKTSVKLQEDSKAMLEKCSESQIAFDDSSLPSTVPDTSNEKFQAKTCISEKEPVTTEVTYDKQTREQTETVVKPGNNKGDQINADIYEGKVSKYREKIKRKKSSSACVILENNILILLSRVSQMNNPSMHLVTEEVMSCLLDYIATMEAPLARCPRLLSRVLRNPLCFQKLMMLSTPLMIYEKLLKNEDLNRLMRALKSVCGKSKKRHRTSSESSASSVLDIESDCNRFSLAGDSGVGEQPSKRQRMGSAPEHQGRNIRGTFHSQHADVCSPGKSGLALLQDLSGVLESQFGRGTIDSLQVTLTPDLCLHLCINVIYIAWSYGGQLYFTQGIVLDKLDHILRGSVSVSKETFMNALAGIRLYSIAMGTRERYQFPSETSNRLSSGCMLPERSENRSTRTSITKTQKHGTTSTDRSERTCALNDLKPGEIDTVVFKVKEEKIVAIKSKLVTKSEIFAAMLEGQYSEAKLSEIPIPETTVFAFQCLVHYLHDCGTKATCDVIENLNTQPVNKDLCVLMIDLINEADKYMIHDLKQLAMDSLCKRYIVPASARSVFEFGVLHRRFDLMKAAVSCVFVDTNNVIETNKYVCDFLESKYCDVFLDILYDILTE